MKFLKIVALTSVAALSATSGVAQSMFSGSIGVEYIYAPKDVFDYQAQINGSLIYTVSPKLQFQFDLGVDRYQNASSNGISYGLHAIYSPSDMLDLGVFYSIDEGFNNAGNAGIEAAYRFGAFNIEAVASLSDISSTSNRYFLGLEGGYNFGSVGSIPDVNIYAGATIRHESDGSVEISNYYAGVKANVWNNLDVNLRAASMDNGEFTYYTLGLEYAFGKGPVFAQRDFSGFFPGY